jgi:hypothetical protein
MLSAPYILHHHLRGGAMQERMAGTVNKESAGRFVRNFNVLEHIDPGPDSYVDLQYETHKNPEYVRVCARNHHPSKTIHAYFYTLNENEGAFIPAEIKGRTIKACLKPSESTVLHFGEKRLNPQLFLFNAFFADGN